MPEEDSIIVDAPEFLKLDTVDMRIEGIEIDSEFDRISTNDTGRFDPVIAEDAADMVEAVTEERDLKTWKIKAKNAHDFIFCADPELIYPANYIKDYIESYMIAHHPIMWLSGPASEESKFECRWLLSITS